MRKCLICKNELHKLISFNNMPASAQNIPSKDELINESAIRLDLCQCVHCGLVQFDTEPVDYYKDVIRCPLCAKANIQNFLILQNLWTSPIPTS